MTRSVPPPQSLRSLLALDAKKLRSFAVALLVGSAFVASAAAFHRELPPEPTPPPGMKVGKTDVTLESNAPQWKVLRLAQVKLPEPHYTDAFPARFTVDEALASKVGTPLAGRVTTVFVVLGQNVKRGDPLFSVASPDIAGLRAEREKALVGLEASKADFQRVKAMVEAKALPEKDQLASDRDLREAQLSVRLAETKLSSLRVSSRSDNEFTVVAPRDGVVIEKSVLPAQQVDANTPLVGVADLSRVRVAAELFEADAVTATKGGKVQISSPSMPGFAAETTISLVSQVADPERHTVSVWADLPNAEGNIRPNVFAELRLLTSPPAGTLEIPTSALVSDGSHQYVYVATGNGRFERRSVVAGPSRDDRLLVFKGLTNGETVVEQGAVLLDNQIALVN